MTQRGFSLLELVVATTLTVVLIGAVAALINQNQQVFVTESGVTDMNQNVRTALDLLTRDIQSAGAGFPRGTSVSARGNFAAIFYQNGAGAAPDSLMIINGDPFAPTSDVESRAAGSATFFLFRPPDIDVSGVGAGQQFGYGGPDGTRYPIYRRFQSDPRRYIVYDDNHAMVFEITSDAQTVGVGAGERIQVQHNPTSYSNPPSVFGSPVDTTEPDYDNAKVAILDATIGYRLNTATGELERTEDLASWYSIARGITDFQLSYRVISRAADGSVSETVTDTPGVRRDIRSVIVTIAAETPDAVPGDRHYRRVIQRLEAAPRNLNLLHNNNLSQ